MHKKAVFMLSLLATICTQLQAITADKSLWYGSIDFPSDMKTIPPVRIYYTGNKIPTDIDHEGHHISFAISEYSARHMFYLIIVDTVDFVSEQNTVRYLKVPQNRPYKLYQLTFKPNKETIRGNQSEIELSQRGNWDIVHIKLEDTLRIPDNAIIVCYHSQLIKTVEGGNALELPHVIIDREMVAKLTDQELHDASIQFLLTSLNCDSFHTLPETQIKADFAHKTVIALTS